MGQQRGRLPSSVAGEPGWFDRFAAAASHWVSQAWFFSACLLMVLVWAPSYLLFGSVDTWQLVINTATTIVTFLLVALLQNTQQRADQATQHKLNAIATATAELMRIQVDPDDSPAARGRLARDRYELLVAVGLEERESA